MSKALILCADDFAQNAAVTDGILQLLDAKRLTAVSCMTESPRWEQDAESLKPYSEQADIGVHLNLTHSFGQKTWPLSTLMTASLRRRISPREIEDRLQYQLDRFESAMGRQPDFVDGHQHVHAFPWIRNIVHQALAPRYPEKRPYLRSVALNTWKCDAPVKAMVLWALTRGADREAEKAGLRLNRGFAGLYSLSPKADYDRYMQAWLETAANGTLLMCHPGRQGDDTSDPSAAARPKELSYLLSDAFRHALEKTDARLSRFQSI